MAWGLAMEAQRKIRDPLIVFLAVAGVSLVWGLTVPSVYYFLDAGRSSSTVAAMEQAAVLVAVMTAIGVLAAWWFQRETPESKGVLQFGVKELLVATLAVAIVLGVGSRLSLPSVRQWILVSIVAAAIVAALWWRSRRKTLDVADVDATRSVQFGVRELLTATLVSAIGLVIALYLGKESIAGMSVALWQTALVAVAFVFFDSRVRWRFATWMAAMILPFWWVVAYNKPFGPVSGIVGALPIGGGLFPAFISRQLFDFGGPDRLMVFAAVFAGLISASGLWIARKGRWLFGVLLVLLLLQNGFAALVFYALYRA